MHERNPYRRRLSIESKLAGAVALFYATVAATTEIRGIIDVTQGSASIGGRLLGGGLFAAGVAAGYEVKRRHARQLRRAYEAQETIQQ